MKQYFGIDIGGTSVKLGIVDETGKVLVKGEQSVSFDGYQPPFSPLCRTAAQRRRHGGRCLLLPPDI